MKRTLIGFATAAAMGLIAAQPVQAGGNGGAVAAGVIGGLAAGAIIGGAAAQPRYYGGGGYGYYGGPSYVYETEPVYGPSCYYTRGRPVWDDYRGVWIRPRVRVCD